MRRFVVTVVLLALLVPLLWSALTTPSLTSKSVPIKFEWRKQSGFSNVRSIGGLARVLDPGYDHYFTNPIVTAQSKALILSQIKHAESENRRGFVSVKGRLDVRVCCLGYVQGLDSMSEASHVETE